MKRLSVLVFVIQAILVSPLFADYSNPPLWENNVDFTHQSWAFNGTVDMELDGPPLPLIADGQPNWVNDFGDPVLISFENSHEWMKGWYVKPPQLTTDRRCMYGGMGNSYLTFFVPNNYRDENWHEQLWIQMTYFARKDGAVNYAIEIARDANFIEVNGFNMVSEFLEALNEPEGITGKWYRITAIYDSNDQPDFEYIRLTALYDPNPFMAASMIDQVDIDTRCLNVADLNEDGVVNFIDYAIFALDWKDSEKLTAGLDLDGIVDNKDLKIFCFNWLK